MFKSAKLIPTMLVGVILDARAARLGEVVKNRKKYGMYEYASAFLLSVGAAGFCMNANESDTDSDETNVIDKSSSTLIGSHLIGLGLLTTSVFCDAIVPNIQEKLMHGTTLEVNTTNSNPNDVEMKSLMENRQQTQSTMHNTQKGLSSLSLMVNTNAIGFILLLISTILSSSIIPIMNNIIKHPHYFLLLLTVGFGLGSAVLSYTELIRRSGKRCISIYFEFT